MKYFFPVLLLFLNLNLNAQFNLVWEEHFNGVGDKTDRFLDMVSDNNGNVYATGYTYSRSHEHDLLVAKFSSTGALQWADIYQGPANDDDEGLQVKLDSNGDLIVVGTSNNDFITIKYDPAGNRKWLQLFDGQNEDEDAASLLVVDSNDNIYVIGESEVSPGNSDITMVKYDPTGMFLFEKNFTSSGTRTDRPYDAVIDNNDIIYIAGRYSSGIDFEGVVVAYNTSGNIQWTNNLTSSLGDDRFSELHLMGGSLYVAGRTFNVNNDDMVIRKINPSGGATVWNKVYDSGTDDRPEALTGNGSSQLWLAGRSRAPAQLYFDTRTMKLNTANGDIDENITYSINADARPRDIIMQGSDVYVGGIHEIGQQNDLLLLKYDNFGNQQWIKSFAGPDDHTDELNAMEISNDFKLIAVGRGSNGSDQEDAMLIKYDLSGALEFNEFYTGVGDNRDVINDMTVDNQDNTIQVGYTYEKDNRKNYMVVKTDANGAFMWLDTLESSGNGRDEAVAVATDPANNVYVTGFLNNNIQTVVYDPSGTVKWSKIYNHWAIEEDRATDILVNSSFETYVLGYSDIDSTGVRDNEIVLLKYDPSGNLLWIRYQTHPKDDEAFEMAFDASENIYIAGKSSIDTVDFDAVVYKMTPAGTTDWIYYAGDTLNDRFTNIEVRNGKVYAGGRFKNVADGDDAVIQCLDLAGNLQWENTVSEGLDEVVYELAVADNGYSYIACRSDDTLTARNSVLVGYDPSGVEQWRHHLNTDLKNHINDLAIDNDDEILYTTGSIKTSGLDDLIAVNSYQLYAGISGTSTTFKAGQSGDNEGIGIVLSSTTPLRFYTAGIGFYDVGQQDFTVLCYDYTPVSVEDLITPGIRLFPSLITKGTSTLLSVEGVAANAFEFTLYDSAGKQLWNRIGESPEVSLPPIHNAGLYTYRITQDGNMYTGKLMVQ